MADGRDDDRHAGWPRKKKIHGVLGLGGTQGTTLCTQVMRALPYGFPKVMVSTMASGNVAPGWTSATSR